MASEKLAVDSFDLDRHLGIAQRGVPCSVTRHTFNHLSAFPEIIWCLRVYPDTERMSTHGTTRKGVSLHSNRILQEKKTLARKVQTT